MEIENDNQNDNNWTPEYEGLIKDIKKKRAEIKRKRDNPFAHFTMPIAMKVAAHTIGLDLVSVQPMASPKGNLFYLDYIYGESKYDKRKRIVDKLLGKTEEKNTDSETHFTIPSYGELSHPDNTNFTIEVKEIDESVASKVYSKWSPIIDKLTNNPEKRNWLNDYCNMHSSSGFSI